MAKRRLPARKIVRLRTIIAALRFAMEPRSDLSAAALRLNNYNPNPSKHIFWRVLNLKDAMNEANS
jgi:hypothetical protein